MPNAKMPQAPTLEARRPPEPTAAELALARATLTTPSAADLLADRPTMEPPGSAVAATATVAAGWLTNKHVLMLWQTAGATDNWFYLDGGTGWRRTTQTSETAARGVSMLAAAAKASGGAVHVYEGATAGVIDGIYLW